MTTERSPTLTATPEAAAEPGDRSSAPWWRAAVIYQIYVRSFADGNGDGIGDFAGIRSRLPYLQRLGVDAIWLNPFYPSPQVDGGYDVADYYDVDPRFGTLGDFDLLVESAHALGLRVIIDIVPNHTSSSHPWFVEALAAPAGSPARARYLFRNGAGAHGDEPPNNWRSRFGGPAWTRVDGPDDEHRQWYLHLFDSAQPDLDWLNAEVRREFESVLRFWLDRGVDGFRIDVAHGLAKDPEMPDVDGNFAVEGRAGAGHPHWDRDEVHDVYRDWRRIVDSYAGDRTLVGEIWLESVERVARYVRSDELHTAFNFDFLEADFEPASMRAVIDRSIAALTEVGASPTWVLSNHDVTRHVTRYGGGERGRRRARAAALLMLALPGGAYIYQGEELGLEEVLDRPDHLRQDPTFRRTGGAKVGRDGCRVPIPWSGELPPFGFGAEGAWLPQPIEWSELTVERQDDDPQSMLNLYRDALRLRRRLAHVDDARLEWLASPPAVLAFRRPDNFVCVVNMGDRSLAVPGALDDADVLIASVPLPAELIPSLSTVWMRTRPRETHGERSAPDGSVGDDVLSDP